MTDSSKIPEKLGTRLLETVIASTEARPDVRQLLAPDPRAWSLQFPDLTHLPIDAPGDTDAKICIATEDIVGPVRNGGIGTTYSFLAKELAAEGFDVTILYLRGDYVEIGTLDEWIDHYAEFGVTFKVVEDYYARENGLGPSDRWTAPMYNMLRHLQDTQYDVVHVSEWRGSGYLSLLAKRQGWALQETHFVVKCSSPWLWSRLYGSQPLNGTSDLCKIHAEQRSVELGDHIIGGSAHLLRWMASQGYSLVQDRTFVQPNILSTDVLDRLIAERPHQVGDLVPIEEIVFFGRLEARKGLDIFCQAIDDLIEQGATLPDKITFMGKPGVRLETNPDVPVLDHIQQATAQWPARIEILTELQQEDALRYLLGGNRLAVMPSHIENSSLAVYEAVTCRIPFVATNTGGTPELVDSAYQADVLCDAHPLSLRTSLARALEQGGRVAGGTFDNTENTATWIQYHRNIKQILADTGAAETRLARPDKMWPKVAAIIPHRDDIRGLKATLKSLRSCGYPNLEIIVVDDGSRETATRVEFDRVKRKLHALGGRVIETPGIDDGLAANAGWQATSADLLYLTRPGNGLLPGGLDHLVQVLVENKLGAVTGFALEYRGAAIPMAQDQAARLRMPILGNIDYTMLESDTHPWDLLISGEAFDKIGGFTGDFRQVNAEKELYHALEFNGYPGQTVPRPTYWTRSTNDRTFLAGRYNLRASAVRSLRPSLRYGPQFYRNFMLLTFGLLTQAEDLKQTISRLRENRDAEKQLKLQRLKELEEVQEKLAEARAALQQVKQDRDRHKDTKRQRTEELEQVRRELRALTEGNPDILKTSIDTPDKVAEAGDDTVEDLNEAGLSNQVSDNQVSEMKSKLAARNAELKESKEQLKDLRQRLRQRNAELDELRQSALGKVADKIHRFRSGKP